MIVPVTASDSVRKFKYTTILENELCNLFIQVLMFGMQFSLLHVCTMRYTSVYQHHLSTHVVSYSLINYGVVPLVCGPGSASRVTPFTLSFYTFRESADTDVNITYRLQML